ncbi:hypothetical protein ACFQ44_04660 [Levilactobacillus lanxiensis]|uniref:Uncharacterized protein n=1 Tax=Levilactobacillus lanxiensis TaxID=2799568 RepID=A0ABW4D219_9LACO|nr:hypothetical protein [Levilactobacillus lanxiensis]
MKLLETRHVKVSLRRTTHQEMREEIFALIIVFAIVWLWSVWS